ncbi:hypothetical protein BD408DRAFT_471607, partial [Parasitella parasitica]
IAVPSTGRQKSLVWCDRAHSKVHSLNLTRRLTIYLDQKAIAHPMSINKSQGQSSKRIAVDSRCPAFTRGQLYTALSRATSANNVSILL